MGCIICYGCMCSFGISTERLDGESEEHPFGKRKGDADKGHYAMVDATGDTATLVLKEMPAGKCKLYVYHDENGNYQLDREDGVPTENCAIIDLDMTAEAKTIDVELKDVRALQNKAKK